MNHEKYLQENSEEALQMRQKVKDLFYSKEQANVELAYQLIKSGGMHQDFVPILWAFAIENMDHAKYDKIQNLLKKALEPTVFQIFKTWTVSFLETYMYEYDAWEDWADECLAEIGKTPALASQQAEFALAFMCVMKIGGRFALQNALLPVELVLRTLHNVEENSLSLINFRLSVLPSELANMPNLESLYLQGNKFTEVSDALVNLPLENISIEDDLSIQVIEKLERAYPKAMASHHKSRGYSLSQRSQSLQRSGALKEKIGIAEKALGMLQRVSADLQDDSYWFSIGLAAVNAQQYALAIEANEKAAMLNPSFGGGVCFYNMACAYAHLKEKEKMIANLQKSTQYSTYTDWYAEAQIDNDFTYYWKNQDFLNLVSA